MIHTIEATWTKERCAVAASIAVCCCCCCCCSCCGCCTGIFSLTHLQWNEQNKNKALVFFCFKASGVEWKILGMVLRLDDGCLVLTYENAFTLTLAHTRMHTNPVETCCECIFRIKIWHSLSFNIWYITYSQVLLHQVVIFRWMVKWLAFFILITVSCLVFIHFIALSLCHAHNHYKFVFLLL